MEIAGRSFLITGGASGLGAACCRELAAADAKVMIADIDQQAGEHLAEELGTGVEFFATDVQKQEDIDAVVAATLDAHGSLSGLISCAGILRAARVVGRSGTHDLQLFRKVIDVNLNGTFNAASTAADAISKAPPDKDGERGVIIMTASVAAWDGQLGQAAYAASKGGVASMTLPMARELGQHGIRVVSIAPGIFDTSMMETVSDEVRNSLESQIPFPRRFGNPEEFAALARHIFENKMLNGTVIRLDGAVRMAAK